MTCDRCRFEGCTLPGLGLETDAERPCGEGCEHRNTGPTLPDGCAMCLDCGVRVQPRLWAVPGLGAWLSPHYPGSGL